MSHVFLHVFTHSLKIFLCYLFRLKFKLCLCSFMFSVLSYLAIRHSLPPCLRLKLRWEVRREDPLAALTLECTGPTEEQNLEQPVGGEGGKAGGVVIPLWGARWPHALRVKSPHAHFNIIYFSRLASQQDS